MFEVIGWVLTIALCAVIAAAALLIVAAIAHVVWLKIRNTPTPNRKKNQE